jgi:diguanylate cyclase (GGDEF)-like protein
MGAIGLLAGCLALLVIVSDGRRLSAAAADQALRDPLTGLANPRRFHACVTDALQRRAGEPVVVMALDLDDFRLVNDSCGHAVGDAVLTESGRRLRVAVRPCDVTARMHGDEFAVMIDGGADFARLIARRVGQAFDEPFLIDGHDLLIHPSIGLAVAPVDGRGTSSEMLLNQAEAAMNSAKRSRTGRVHVFSPHMYVTDPVSFGDDDRAAGELIRMLSELRHAIAKSDLRLLYQPKYDFGAGQIVGAEALVRWPHPERGLISPGQFLPLVRRHGLMWSLTDFVLARALDDAVWWQSRGIVLPIAVNVFAPSLADPELPAKILHAVNSRKLRPDLLTVEITEDLLLDDLDGTRKVLEKLRYHGIRISIDDFGSGYSALSYLRELPIDEIKLDRQFVAPVLVDWRAAAIVRAVVELAHDLGVKTVAEGVENAEAATRLREFGCDFAQGFLYSPPIPATAIVDLLASTATAPAG